MKSKVKKSADTNASSPTAPCSVKPSCPVVALGASAGGLEVFGQFFERVPIDSGLSFILIQHLDPTHDTLMPELLAKHTQMPVERAVDGVKIAANHVYVIAPNANLRIENCTLRIDPLPPGGDAKVIDTFFRSVALDQKESVVGIILSGTGTDGTLGLKAIKDHGGLTLVQHPDTAKFDGMPRSAISSGFADFVMPVEEMVSKVVEYGRHLQVMQHRKGAEALQQEVIENLPKICPVLRKHTGHDFSRYKESTLARRIQRRMQVMHLDSVSKYVDCLTQNKTEVEALFKDLLISVTQFFRDADSFEAVIKHVIPEIFRDKGEDAQVRIWVPGCATGEEAYSLAIAATEFAEKLKHKPKVQIFATDLDAEALEVARKGKYPLDIAEQVPPQRLKRFFKKSGDFYELIDPVRELCIFSLHNLIKDPPFSRLDLISCRNVLIYLEADLQKKLLPLFHYALNPSGFLFLGPSENVASRSELFRTVDPKHRIFQRRPSVLHKAATLPVIDPGHVTRLQTLATTAITTAPKEQNIARSIERLIVEEYAPASVVINEQGEVVYFAGDTGKFLKPPAGTPNNKLVAMARENLRLELRTAVHRAISSRKEIVRENLRIKKGLETIQLDLIVRPVTELGADTGLFIVLFRELIPAANGGTPPREEFDSVEHPVIKQLEGELRTTREDLQTTIEELETSNEELKSANEELLSMNEELQSANEELQTSKEEVQSANDELLRKIEETDHANSELRRAHQERAVYAAIVENSDDAIIGKTLDGIITSWNRAAERIFGYSSDDIVGQSILRIIPPERHEEEGRILQKLRRGERVEHYETERITKSGRTIQVSLTASPIRDPQGFIVGASKIARDITAQTAAARSSMHLAAIVDSSDDAIVSKTLDGIVTSWNKGAERIFGYAAAEMVGQPITKIFPPDRLDEETYVLSRIRAGQRIQHFETVRRAKDGTLLDVALTISPIRDAVGNITGASKIARDITVQKAAARASQLLAAIVDSSDDAIVSKRLDGIVTSWNKAAERLFGYTASEMIGHSITRLFPQDRLEEEPKIITRISRGERVEHFETVRKHKDGKLINVSLTISPVKDAQGLIVGASKIARDITTQKEMEEALRRNEHQFRSMAESIPQLAWMAEPDGSIFWYNQRWYEYTGTTLEQMQGWGWKSVHDPAALPGVIAQWQRSLETGEAFEMEFPLRGADGVFRWFLTRVNALRDGNGRIIRWFGTNTNIDELRRTQQALQDETRVLELLNDTGAAIASELKLEALVQLVTDAGTKLSGASFGAFFYNVINENGEAFVLYTLSGAPRSAFEKFGMPRNTPIFHPTFKGEGVVRLHDVTKDSRYGTMPPHHGMPKGHLPVRSYLAAPVVSRSGEVIGGLFFGHPEPGVFTERSERLIVGIAAQAAVAIDNARLFETAQREIKHRTETEAALQKAKDDLELRVQERTASLLETTEQLETFCYSVAHDLRSPLRAQQTFAQALIENYDAQLDADGREYTRRILRNAERLDRLVNDLLTYSRLSRSELKFENVSLEKVVGDVQKALAHDIEKSRALITTGPLQAVVAYEPTLNLIVTNLVANAMKFVKPGEAPAISIRSEERSGRVRLWVEDQGIGIHPDGLNKIFGVFQRLHPVDKYPGTGIGLAIVQKGAERMGGSVGVESEMGKGSRFWVELPAVRNTTEAGSHAGQ